MKFLIANQPAGSTALGKAVLAAAVPALSKDIKSVANWRKDYLPFFSAVAIAEQQSRESAFAVAAKGLAEFEEAVYTDDGRKLIDAIRLARRENKAAITFVAVSGSGAVKKNELPVADLVKDKLAEAALPEKKTVRGANCLRSIVPDWSRSLR